MPSILLDFSRLPNAKERKAFASRISRLEGSYGKMVKSAAGHLHSRIGGRGPLLRKGFQLRKAFSYQEKAPTGNYSDRTVPPRGDRPPATRISSSRGSTLRLYLLAIALTQMEKGPGGEATTLPIVGDTKSVGWTDLIATDAEDFAGPNDYIASKDKRARSVRSCLKKLDREHLLKLVASTGKRGSLENYHLLEESGGQSDSILPYTVPRQDELLMTLPPSFILNSWIHVLEDSEIALLLMISCGKGGYFADGRVAIPSDVRLLHYGIARDPYMLARKTLEQFGLIEVEEIGRHFDGRADAEEGYFPHRFRIVDDGFEADALFIVIDTLKRQLSRI